MVRGGVINGDRAIRRLEAISPAVINAVNKSLAEDTVKMDADIKSSIQKGGRSGRKYKRRTIVHQASAKGEFPKSDTGSLVAGQRFRVKRSSAIIKAEIENRAEHAKYLEFKPTSSGGRPFMRPSARKWTPKIKKNLNIAVKGAI